MTATKVGFMTPQNETYLMTYNEVNDFCKLVCEQEKYLEQFNEFSKNYTYFYPYFDFVMFELDYIFINPLLEEGTCLKKVGNALYKVSEYVLDDEENIYECITSLAKSIKNGGNYADLVACSDKELNIRKCNIADIHKCMIDPDGFTMISTNDGEKDGNHEVTSSTIINQLLITSKYLYQTYDSKKYTASYLIEKFGFIRADSIEYGGNMVGVGRFLSDIVKSFKDLCIKEKNCVFYDWEDEFKIVDEKREKYKVKVR